MKANIRSFSGATLMLVIIPIIAGLLACMPVPVGNPERSRIDPELSGVWALNENGEESGYYFFRPYDKRTWLVVGVGGSGGEAEPLPIYKAWLTKLGGEKFMTWEQAGAFNKDGSIQAEYWLVFRVEKDGENQVNLRMLDYEYEGFEAIPEPDDYEGDFAKDMRRRFERVIGKNVDDDEMYDDTLVLRRLAGHELAEASDRFQEVVSFE